MQCGPGRLQRRGTPWASPGGARPAAWRRARQVRRPLQAVVVHLHPQVPPRGQLGPLRDLYEGSAGLLTDGIWACPATHAMWHRAAPEGNLQAAPEAQTAGVQFCTVSAQTHDVMLVPRTTKLSLRTASQVVVSNTRYDPRSNLAVFMMGSVLGIRVNHTL